MNLAQIILIIIIILGLLGIVYINIYNKIMYLKTKIDHVEFLIDEDLRSKYDLIKRSSIDIKDKTGKDYLKEFTNLEDEKISNFDFDRKLKEAEIIIKNLINDNSEIAKSKNIKEIIPEFKRVDEKITAQISYYNHETKGLNNYIRRFPNNLVAMINKIKIKAYFDGKDLTDDDTDDFKA